MKFSYKKVIGLIACLLITNFTFSQCNIQNFTATKTNGTCLANGKISVNFPTSVTCVGWAAEILKSTGEVTSLNVPINGGPLNFESLQPGSYTLSVTNGIETFYFSNNPLVITSTYVEMVINATSTAPTCNANGTLTVNVPTGGIGPFTYNVISQSGTQTFTTPNRTHTFSGMASGEVVTVNVTDNANNQQGCMITKKLTPTIATNTTPAMTYDFRAYNFIRDCANCTAPRMFINLFGNTASQIATLKLPGNATITIPAVNGTTYDLSWDTVSNRFFYDASLPGRPQLYNGLSIKTNFFNGCTSLTRTSPVSLIDNYLGIQTSTETNSADCSVKYRIRVFGFHDVGNGGFTDRNVYFCKPNTITFEYSPTSASGPWTSLTIGTDVVSLNTAISASNLLNVTDDVLTSYVASCDNAWYVTNTGFYRVVGSDGCHSVTRIFNITTQDAFSSLSVNEDTSVLEGTSSIRVGLPNIAYKAPMTIKISRTDGQTSMALTASNPHTLAGNYNITFPIIRVVTPSANDSHIISDLPLGSYKVEISDGCTGSNNSGLVRTIVLTKPATYNPTYTFDIGCVNSNTIFYNLNTTNVNKSNANVKLYKDAGNGVLGAFVAQSTSPSDFTSGSFNGLPSGNYVLLYNTVLPSVFVNYLNQYSAALNRISPFQYRKQVSIENYEDLTLKTSTAFCVAPSTGKAIVDAEVSGTVKYPLTFTLYKVLDPTVPPYVDSEIAIDGGPFEVQSPAKNYTFPAVPIGKYYVVAKSFCKTIQQNLDVTAASLVPIATVKDEVLCLQNNLTTVALTASNNLYDITWSNNVNSDTYLGNPYVVSPTQTTIYTACFVLKEKFNCTYSVPYCASVTVKVIPNPNLNVNASDIDLCLNANPIVKIENTDSNYLYELVNSNGNSFTPPLVQSGTGGTITYQIPPSIPLSNGDYLLVKVYVPNINGCVANLIDKVLIKKGEPDKELAVNALPVGNIICAGLPASITIKNTQIGVTYEILKNGLSLSPPVVVTGNGNDIITNITSSNLAIGDNIFTIKAKANTCSEAILSNTVTVTVLSKLSQDGPTLTECSNDGLSYKIKIKTLGGTAPYTVSGTGSPGTWTGNEWTSDFISSTTNYNVEIKDSSICSSLIVSGNQPNCCIFNVVCPTFTTQNYQCISEIPSVNTLTAQEFLNLGTGGSITSNCGVVEVTAKTTATSGCGSIASTTYTINLFDDTNSNQIHDANETTILNTKNCTHNYTISDTVKPTISGNLSDSISYGNLTTPFPQASTSIAQLNLNISDNCSTFNDLEISNVDSTEIINCNSKSIIRTYSIKDQCGNINVVSQTLKVIDNSIPTTKPILTVSSPICNSGGYFTIEYSTNGVISATGTNVSINENLQIITANSDIVIIATNGCGVTTESITKPFCPDICSDLTYSLGNPICTPTGYDIAYTVSPGTTVTAEGAIVTSNVISITNASFIKFIKDSCEKIVKVTKPICDCDAPAISLGTPVCNGSTYSISIAYSASTTVVTNGTLIGNQITQNIGSPIVVSATMYGCQKTQSMTINPPSGSAPTLTVSSPECNTNGTYTVSYISNATSVTATGTNVSINTTSKTITASSDILITASIGCGFTTASITKPVCPDTCNSISYSLGNPICTASGFDVAYTVSAGTTVTAVGATISNGVISLTQTTLIRFINGSCEKSIIVTKPNCDNPCDTPAISLGTPVCNGLTYSISIAYSASTTVVTNGTLIENQITQNIGSPIVVTATINGCPKSQTVTINPPSGSAPTLTVSSPECNTNGTYTVSYISNATSVTATGTNVSINTTSKTITASSDILITASIGCGFTTASITKPVCPDTCNSISYSLGNPICTASGFDVAYTVSAGTTVTAVGATISNGVISLTQTTLIRFINGSCEKSIIVTKPNCDNPCDTPAISLGTPVCNGSTYSISIAYSASTTVVTNGTLIGNQITQNIGSPIVVTATINGCPKSQTVTINPPSGSAPTLTVSSPECNTNGTYTVSYISNATSVTATGTNVSINTTTKTITASSDILIAASIGCGFTTTSITKPVCPDTCNSISYSLGNPICTASGFDVAYTVSAGTTVTAVGATISNGVISLTQTTLIRFINGSCEKSIIVTKPNCDNPCDTPAISLGTPVCNGLTYSISIAYGASTVVTNATLIGNEITQNIGSPIVVTATINGCPKSQTVTINPPSGIAPILTLSNPKCNADGTYQVAFTTNGKITTNLSGVIITDTMVTNIILPNDIIITSSNGCFSTEFKVKAPDSCPQSPDCEALTYSIGNPVCQGSTYSIAFVSAPAGAIITLDPSTAVINGSSITNIPIDKNLKIKIQYNSCSKEIEVIKPLPCDDPCNTSFISFNSATCEQGKTYTVTYINTTGAIVSIPPGSGTITGTTATNVYAIKNIPYSLSSITIKVSLTGCDSIQEVTIQRPNCEETDLCKIVGADCDKDGNPNETDPHPYVPTAIDDLFTAKVGIPTSYDIIKNDDYFNVKTISITEIPGGTAKGTIVFDVNTGTVTYTPLPSEKGKTVTIFYEVCNIAENPKVCASATITIVIDECGIIFYNAVARDSSYGNDFLKIDGLECTSENNIEIFNRWGIKVFEKSNYSEANAFKGLSDGRSNIDRGTGLAAGTYFYIFNYTTKDDNISHTQSGYIYLN